MDKKIVYQDNSSMISVETLYYIGEYVTYEVSVTTYGFSGTCNFCINENKLKEYIQIVDVMIKTLNGELEICDCESDAFIKCFFENPMNLYILGQIGGSYEDNNLKFKFKADQTMLYMLKMSLLNY